MSTTRRPLGEMFDAVARRYDALNRAATFGLDRRWRELAATELLSGDPERLLDIGTGTGDLALLVAKRAGPKTAVFGVDFSAHMIEVARRKAARHRTATPPSFLRGDAAQLPFPDSSLDAVGIAFALRNLTWRHPNAALHLAEIHRVLRPGGRFVAVETSQPTSSLLRRGAYIYFRVLVAPLAGLVSGEPAAYRYLARSAIGFFSAAVLGVALEEAGFFPVRHALLLGGVAALHTAIRP